MHPDFHDLEWYVVYTRPKLERKVACNILGDMSRVSLYSIKELVSFISIEKRPVIVQEKVIAAIQRVLIGNVEVFTEDYFQEGVKVRIKWGPFAGLEGIISKKNSDTKLIN